MSRQLMQVVLPRLARPLYRQLQRYEHSAFFRRSVLACSLARVSDRISEALGCEQLLPRSDPPEAWRRFGADIKTRAAFHANFAEIPDVLAQVGIEKVDAILADLGLSTNQLFDGHYGLSFAQSA